MTWPTATTTCEEIDAAALWILMENTEYTVVGAKLRDGSWPVCRGNNPIVHFTPDTDLPLIPGDNVSFQMDADLAAEQWLTRSAAVRAGWRAAMPLDDFAREAMRAKG